MVEITIVPILQDNYAYILCRGNKTAIVDPGEAAPVIRKLEEMGKTPAYIFNTHHHWDHTDGNEEIAGKYDLNIVAPERERGKIGRVDVGLKDGEHFDFGDTGFQAIETPGHTDGHLSLWFEKDDILFSGDMIFAMGCGRPIEGTAAQLYESFQKLSFLGDDTKIYCGHEYTLKNAQFCASMAPDDNAVKERLKEVERLRAKGEITIPTTIQKERETNLFMQAGSLEEFQKLRDARNSF
jgi:hydroxyacylglutathione hydrolase